MKRYALCLLALLGASVTARADDLFYEDGAKPVNRNFIFGNVIYEHVQIVGRVAGGQVELKYKGGGSLVVPEKHVPPLWSSAMDKREGQRRIAAQRGIGPGGQPIGGANITGQEKTEVKSLSHRAFEMRALADERCYVPCGVTKSDGTMMQGVLLGFRGRRAEVLFSNYYTVAWVGMYYFHPATAERLSMMDLREEENGSTTDGPAEKPQDTPPKALERDPRIRLMDIILHGPDYTPEPAPRISLDPSLPLTLEQKEIRRRAVRLWPNDSKMQVKEVWRQEEANRQITEWSSAGSPPFGLSKAEWEEIWLRARRDWPGNYRMQVQEIRERMEALAALKKGER